MKAHTLCIPLMIVVSIHAADSTKLPTAHQYPFSNLDKAIFYNYETQKIESPYSTASIETFPKDPLVTIEEDAYHKLQSYAFERSSFITLTAMDNLQKLPAEKREQWQHLKHIETESNKSLKQFQFMKTTGCHSQKIQLSPHDLAHLLQYSNGIKTEMLSMMGGGDVGFCAALLITISLGKSTLVAPPLLKEFIMQARDHEQNKIE